MLLDDGFESENKLGTIKRFFALTNAVSLLVIISFVIDTFINQGLGGRPAEDKIYWYIHDILLYFLPLTNCAYSVYLLTRRFFVKQQSRKYIDLFLIWSPWVYWLIVIIGIGPWIE